MPQASFDLRTKYLTLFNDLGCEHGVKYLEDHGYKLTEKFQWLKPSGDHVPTKDEEMIMLFLFFEWDFGGLKE